MGNRPGALEGLVNFKKAFAGKRIWISGHTGFKGSWLTAWLVELGAEIAGYSLAPKGPLFRQLGLARRIQHQEGDIRDLARLRKSIRNFRPDYVFHLAAQPIVRRSYMQPCETFEVNTLGTVYILDVLRGVKHPCAAVIVTTDKVYDNRGTKRRFRERDPLGGADPYSASKAAGEIIIASYRNSFFKNHPVRIASARAGNVIGGGDWAEDRIFPDCIRALTDGRPISVRNPLATRPWQHVLEPIAGYLHLGASLSKSRKLSGAYNFGPASAGNRTVEDLVREILQNWPGCWKKVRDIGAPYEAALLQLDNSLAKKELGWSPIWNFRETVHQAVFWYQSVEQWGKNPLDITTQQIRSYAADANKWRAH